MLFYTLPFNIVFLMLISFTYLVITRSDMGTIFFFVFRNQLIFNSLLLNTDVPILMYIGFSIIDQMLHAATTQWS